MTTLTMHVDDAFATTIRDYAMTTGKSMSTAMRELLASALDLVGAHRDKPRNDLAKFWGKMPCTEADACRYAKNVAPFSKIDEDLWK